MISKNQIKQQYKANNSLKPDHFEKFVLSVFEKFTDAKKAINALFGLFGHDYNNSNTHHFTTKSEYAMLAVAVKGYG